MGMMLRRNLKARAEKKAALESIKKAPEPKGEEPVVEEVKNDAETVEWTAEEINKMPYMKLKSVAKKNGVDVVDKETSDIRSELIEKLGL